MCVSCNFFYHICMRFCIWSLKLYMRFLRRICLFFCVSCIQMNLTHMRFCRWSFFTTYEVLHLTSELTYKVFPAQRWCSRCNKMNIQYTSQLYSAYDATKLLNFFLERTSEISSQEWPQLSSNVCVLCYRGRIWHLWR